MFERIDIELRKLFSYIYRAIIIVFAWTIVFQQQNIFTLRIYLMGTIIYIGLFLIFRITTVKPFIRLVLDFCFVGFVLWDKDCSLYQNYFLIILPIINSPNHSSEKTEITKRYYVYPVVILLISVLLYPKIYLESFVPVLCLIVIDQFLKLRSSIEKIHAAIFSVIDEFYAKNFGQKELVKVYEGLIQKLAGTSYTKKLKVSNIACFSVVNENIILVNSSKSIYQYELPPVPDIIEKLKGKRFLSSPSIKIDNVEVKNSAFFLIKGNERRYLFVVFHEDINVFTKHMLMGMLLFPTLKHLARLFEIQFNLNQTKQKNLNNIKGKQEYVLKATEVMHFVNNSLSPIKSALSISKMFDEEKDMEKQKYLHSKLVTQREQALIEIKNITERANYILEKSTNPFIVTNIQVHTFYELYNSTRRKWTEHFPNSKITISSISLISLGLSCLYDNDSFIIVLTDIIRNIEKYSVRYQEIFFFEEQEYIKIEFVNDIDTAKNDIKELRKMAEAYNLNERWEINKRKTNGLIYVRLYLTQMNMLHRINIVDDRLFNFEIKVPKSLK